MTERQPVVAVIDDRHETREMLEAILKEEGYRTVSETLQNIREIPGKFDVYVARNNPSVLLIDCSRPYAANWRLIQRLMASPVSQNRGFVITTPDKKQLEGELQQPTDVLELGGIDFTIETILNAVNTAYNRTIQAP